MRLFLILLFTVSSIFSFSQNNIVGEYSYYTFTINIYEDSTFHIEYHFDLITDIGHGSYKIVNDTLFLEYTQLFDTTYYYDSIDPTNKLLFSKRKMKLKIIQNDSMDIKYIDADFEGICCGIGANDRFPRKLYYKNMRLYFILKNGKLNKIKEKNIYGRKVKPNHFVKEK